MAHIKLTEGIPGIVGAFMAYPKTGLILKTLANALLIEDTPTFTQVEREIIASYVSNLNNCIFCSESHGAVADCRAQQPGLARQIWDDPNSSELSEKMKLMLVIAKKVQTDARSVLTSDAENLIKLGFSQSDFHDLILIASAFCMFNRYVDGLGTFAPERNHQAYAEMGKIIAEKGYNRG